MCVFVFGSKTMQAVRFELTKQTAQDLKPCPFDRSGTLACFTNKNKNTYNIFIIYYLYIY